MSEEKKTMTLGLKGNAPIRGTDQVRQSFPHGRSKPVQVEHVKVRNFNTSPIPDAQPAKVESPNLPQNDAKMPIAPSNAERPILGLKTNNTDENKNNFNLSEQQMKNLNSLSPAERESRIKALEKASEFNKSKEMERDKLRMIKAAEEERRKSEEQSEMQKRKEEDEKRRKEEEERRRREQETKKKSEETAKLAGMREKPKQATPAPVASGAANINPTPIPSSYNRGAPKRDDEEEISKKRKKNRNRNNQEEVLKSGKINIHRISLSEDDEAKEKIRSIASMKRAKLKEKSKMGGFEQPEKIYREVSLPDMIQVADLANRMSERLNFVIKELMKLGVMANQNMMIDADTAQIVAETMGHTVKRVADADIEITVGDRIEDANELLPRPPVVTVMGHVDHGKTSLLDALRQTDVAAGEAGGITQHIGAYSVNLKDGRQITFLDTPGHEAFTAMRARGANATDIVVLVVAADDGIQPQTIEAIKHAKAANVPIVVAINKCDKADAEPDKIRNQLLQHEIVVEQLSGDVQCIEVSAKKGINLDKLEEAILNQALIMDLQANPNREARGVVIEAKLEKGRGAVVTVLIKKGTLKLGDVYVVGSVFGRVRALQDDKGRKLESAGPSQPCEIIGLQGLPEAGDEMIVVESDAQARQLAEARAVKKRDAELFKVRRSSMDQMFQNIKDGSLKSLPIVIKTDVQGSLEALSHAFQRLDTSEVQVQILYGSVGAITETDITLASSSNGIIIGFNVRANPQARDLAKRLNTDIRYYSIIYEALDDVRMLLGGLLAPDVREEFLGYAQIREVFTITGSGKIAGCMVTEGMVKRGAKIRLLRDNVVVYDGALRQLKRFKDDAKEVANGYECGIQLENFDDIQKNDVIECYELKTTIRKLD